MQAIVFYLVMRCEASAFSFFTVQITFRHQQQPLLPNTISECIEISHRPHCGQFSLGLLSAHEKHPTDLFTIKINGAMFLKTDVTMPLTGFAYPVGSS